MVLLRLGTPGLARPWFRFLLRQMSCLRPGGWVVHTAEDNLSSNDDTIAR
jgi:hypothetical protein